MTKARWSPGALTPGLLAGLQPSCLKTSLTRMPVGKLARSSSAWPMIPPAVLGKHLKELMPWPCGAFQKQHLSLERKTGTDWMVAWKDQSPCPAPQLALTAIYPTIELWIQVFFSLAPPFLNTTTSVASTCAI